MKADPESYIDDLHLRLGLSSDYHYRKKRGIAKEGNDLLFIGFGSFPIARRSTSWTTDPETRCSLYVSGWSHRFNRRFTMQSMINFPIAERRVKESRAHTDRRKGVARYSSYRYCVSTPASNSITLQPSQSPFAQLHHPHSIQPHHLEQPWRVCIFRPTFNPCIAGDFDLLTTVSTKMPRLCFSSSPFRAVPHRMRLSGAITRFDSCYQKPCYHVISLNPSSGAR